MSADEPSLADEPLSGPLLRMARFFLGETLPQVAGARDVYALAREMKERGIPVRASEENALRKTLWSMLQLQNDQEESELHQALALLASLLLAVIEDDDFSIPDDMEIRTVAGVEQIALALQRQHYQQNMTLGVAIGVHDLTIHSADDLRAIEARLPEAARTEEIQRVLQRLRVHLGQGEQLLAGQTDPERAARHRARFESACQRASIFLARLLAVPPGQDHPVLRANIIRREHRRIEVDALGAERIGDAEQMREARRLLAWTEEDLGETLTDENKAQLAERLQQLAAESEDTDSGSGWFFGME